MIGVTIASPRYASLAQQAVDSFRASTGCDAVVIHTTNEGNYDRKLNLHRLFSGQKQSVIYFDSDTLWVGKADLSKFEDREAFLAVHDPCLAPGYGMEEEFPVADCKAHGLDPEAYFNSGIFIFNHRHEAVFEKAKWAFKNLKFKDFGEQSSLNYGVQHSPVKFELIGEEWNFFPFAHRRLDKVQWPVNLHVVHAAGYPPHLKERVLQAFDQQLFETHVLRLPNLS